MQLTHIKLLNFKNIAEANLDFSTGVNCLLGQNGMGKSNLLEAIHFLSFARPFSSIPESALIRHGEDLLLAKGAYEMDAADRQEISCGITRGKPKSLKLNGKEYPRISKHIGRFPLVIVAPQDSRLVNGSGEERRRLLDIVISQTDPTYLATLIRYNRALDARNRMLRAGVKDPILYESVEDGMQQAAETIHTARRSWTEAIAPLFARFYTRIAGGSETASLEYKSILNHETLLEALRRTRGKDAALGYTSTGPHRDDLEMTLDDYSIRRLGSQGQIKTYTTALRFAIFHHLRHALNETPILLLDDIFDKLDADRVSAIMDLVSTPGEFGQIFITDTNRKHLDEIINNIHTDKQLFEVNQGTFTPLK